MKLIKLAVLTYSRSYLPELFMFILVALLVVLFSAAVVPRENLKLLSQAAENGYKWDTDNMIIYSPSGINSADEWQLTQASDVEKIRGYDGVRDVLESGAVMGTFFKGSDLYDADMVLYADNTAEYLDLSLSHGKINFGTDENGRLRVVVSPSLAKKHKTGETFSYEFITFTDTQDGERMKRNSVKCVVTGVLNSYGLFPVFDQRQLHSDNALAASSLLNDRQDVILAQYDETIIPDFDMRGFMLILTEESADTEKLRLTLEKEMGTSGTFTATKNYGSYFITRIDALFKDDKVNGILFLLVFVFSYGALILLNVLQNKRLFAVLYINGIKTLKLYFVNLTAGLIIFIPAICVGFAITPYYLKMYRRIPFIGISVGTNLTVALIFVMVLCLALLSVYIQRRYSNPALMYKTGY